jgi:hypothetical protein
MREIEAAGGLGVLSYPVRGQMSATDDSSRPGLWGLRAVVTSGGSGIGLATVRLLPTAPPSPPSTSSPGPMEMTEVVSARR